MLLRPIPFFLASSLCCYVLATQVPLEPSSKPRLKGRFLQITDIHPDPYYERGASLVSACHHIKKKKKGKKKNEVAGFYGTPFGECDTPFVLSNYTFDWLEKHWSHEIDFVIWTGDNARHDNDHKLPRTPTEIYALNRVIAKRMEEVFTSKGIPVVPSLGNNDVWPHNIMTAGPNSITNMFSSIWKEFLPFPAFQVFQRGAYYSKEVIPDQVAVIALNSMYFYDSNKAVSGCLFHDPLDPGNLQLDWLEVLLKNYRDRDMQVWITGHVPPSPGNYYPECFVRYTELSLRFQDTILGGLFGHMNADHFFFMEANDLELPKEEKAKRAKTLQRDQLFDAIIKDFEELPKASKAPNMDDYHIINVSPPIVPNPYLPTFRVFSYNITGIQRHSSLLIEKQKKKKKKGSKRKHGHRRDRHPDKAAQCQKEPFRDTWACHLNETWHSGGPARNNSLFSPLGYAQYYIPHLELANKSHPPKFKLEYLTYPVENLHPSRTRSDSFYPVPLRNLPKSLRNQSISDSKFAPYGLPDLTIPSWIDLAQKLGNRKHHKLRSKFKRFMYLGADEEG